MYLRKYVCKCSRTANNYMCIKIESSTLSHNLAAENMDVDTMIVINESLYKNIKLVANYVFMRYSRLGWRPTFYSNDDNFREVQLFICSFATECSWTFTYICHCLQQTVADKWKHLKACSKLWELARWWALYFACYRLEINE